MQFIGNNFCGFKGRNKVIYDELIIVFHFSVRMADGKVPLLPLQSKGTNSSKFKTVGRRVAKEHTFLTDVAHVRQMEEGLLKLLSDFHSGQLQAFGNEQTFEKLDNIREQQERLARLHFELDIHQEGHSLESETGRKKANENMERLMQNLEGLCFSIQNLHKETHLGGQRSTSKTSRLSSRYN